MGKKYFFFQGCNFKDEDEDEMGRRRNKNKHAKETKPRFEQRSSDLDDTDVFGFAGGASSPSSSDSGPWDWHGNNSYSSSFSSSNEKKQTAVDSLNVISTSLGFYEIYQSDAWGTVLIPVEDPKALTVTRDEIESIKLIENFPKIPARLWSKWIKLCLYQMYETPLSNERKPEAIRSWCSEKQDFEFYTYKDGRKIHIENPAEVTGPNPKYVLESTYPYHNYSYNTSTTRQLEVSVLLCRKRDDLTQWRILVPKQQVTRASVNAETKKSIDIDTGEIFDIFPPLGWVHAGSSHSHNSMSAFFSSTDDKSELTVPGLHIVIGSIKREAKSYDALASIVLRQCRKKIDIKDVVDTQYLENENFHSNVLECISDNVLNTSTSSSYGSISLESNSSNSSDDDYDTSASGRWPMVYVGEDKSSDEERPSLPVVSKEIEEVTDSNNTSWLGRWKARFLNSYKPYNSNRSTTGPSVSSECILKSEEDREDINRSILEGYGGI